MKSFGSAQVFVSALQRFRRPFRTRCVWTVHQTRCVWLPSGCAAGTKCRKKSCPSCASCQKWAFVCFAYFAVKHPPPFGIGGLVGEDSAVATSNIERRIRSLTVGALAKVWAAVAAPLACSDRPTGYLPSPISHLPAKYHYTLSTSRARKVAAPRVSTLSFSNIS